MNELDLHQYEYHGIGTDLKTGQMITSLKENDGLDTDTAILVSYLMNQRQFQEYN